MLSLFGKIDIASKEHKISMCANGSEIALESDSFSAFFSLLQMSWVDFFQNKKLQFVSSFLKKENVIVKVFVRKRMIVSLGNNAPHSKPLKWNVMNVILSLIR